MNRQHIRSEESTARLLMAASEIVSEVGFEKMTMAAVGERAGYSRGLPATRFGSKDGLVDALVTRLTSVWNERHVVPKSSGKPGLDGVAALLESISEQASTDSGQMRALYVLMFEALGTNTTLRERFVAFHRQMRADLASLIERGQEDGSIRRSVDPIMEAGLIVACLRGIAYQWLLDTEWNPQPAFTHLAASITVRLRVQQAVADPLFTDLQPDSREAVPRLA
jgi:AcrR family transcriptional regulator